MIAFGIDPDIKSCWFHIELVLMICPCRPSCGEIIKVFKFSMIKSKNYLITFN